MAEEVKKTTKKNQEKPTVTKTAKLSVSVVDVSGKEAGTIDLPKEIFGAKINPTLMAQAVRVYLANQRQGTSRTKTRGEVNASTRKIYRQKGTGRARHGAVSAPLFIGGGTTFGPKPRDFSLNFSKKMRRAALFSALTQKAANKEVVVLDASKGVTGKTKEMFSAFKALNLLNKKGKVNKVLLVTNNSEEIKKSTRNLEGVQAANVATLSTYSVLNSRNIVFIKDAISAMDEIYVNKAKDQKNEVKVESKSNNKEK